MKLTDELVTITEKLITNKEALDKAERYIALKKAQLLMSIYKEYTNEGAREAAVTIALENDEKVMLDTLYDLRGEVRKLSLTREVIIETLKQSRIYEQKG